MIVVCMYLDSVYNLYSEIFVPLCWYLDINLQFTFQTLNQFFDVIRY